MYFSVTVSGHLIKRKSGREIFLAFVVLLIRHSFFVPLLLDSPDSPDSPEPISERGKGVR